MRIVTLVVTVALEVLFNATPSSGEIITYTYAGEITQVTQNEGNAIPDLAVGDTFIGYTSFDSNGWNGTSGVVQARINGVNLLFQGDSIYGGVAVGAGSSYSIRVAADRAGAGSSIAGSTFSAGNFGPDLADTDGSAGITQPFPKYVDLAEFETNEFLILGSMLTSGNRIHASGRLTSFRLLPEPTSSCIVLMAGALTALRRQRATA